MHPTGTVDHYIESEDTRAAARRLAGKTADDSRKIDLRAHCEFIEPAKFLEPAKQGPTSSMRERSFQSRFADSGSLSDHDNVADDGAARNGRGNNSRTSPATAEECDMILQSLAARSGN